MATAQLTPDNAAVVVKLFIAAPPARVFQAITDPKQLIQWWGQKGVFRATDSKSDFRVGGKWSIEGIGPNGGPFHMEGEYLEVDPPRLLVQSRRADFVGISRSSCAGSWSRMKSMGCTAAPRTRLERERWCELSTWVLPDIWIKQRAITPAGVYRLIGYKLLSKPARRLR